MYGDTISASSSNGKSEARVGGIPDKREAPADQPPGQEAVLQQGVLAVPSGGSFVLSFTTSTKFRIRCASVPDSIGALFRITDLSVGDRKYLLGATGQVSGFPGATVIQGVRASNFNEFAQCGSLLADACVTTGKPVQIAGTNVSAAPADFEIMFRGEKQPDQDC